MNILIKWLSENYLEAFGMVSGLVYIYYSIKQNILLWPLGIITSGIFVFIFLRVTLYADMSLQLYYVVVSFYGWYFWLKGKHKDTPSGKLRISILKTWQWPILIIITLIMGFVLNYIFSTFTNASNPMWDSMVTAGSIAATWMLARKLLEQWLVWIVVN